MAGGENGEKDEMEEWEKEREMERGREIDRI